MLRRTVSIALLSLACAGALSPSLAQAQSPPSTTPDFKVAFVGDQGINVNAAAVLQLIEDEGADMVLHLGDLGYGSETDPQTAIDWDAQVTTVLGADFPYFATVGNHDVGNWLTYQMLLEDRLANVPGASCTGDYGVMSACTYEGLYFVLSGIGSSPNLAGYQPHIDYLQGALDATGAMWKVCAWHKNQNAMQVGTKPDEVGWSAYELCRAEGALIATAHEHSYERTKTLNDTQTQNVDPLWTDPAQLRVGGGSTFVFVSGLGGHSIRSQTRCLPTTSPYGCNGEWAAISTSSQGASYGALFIEFNVDGDPAKARGYYKNIGGQTVDTFTIVADTSAPVGGETELPGVLDVASRDTEGRTATVAGASAAAGLAGMAVALARRPRRSL